MAKSKVKIQEVSQVNGTQKNRAAEILFSNHQSCKWICKSNKTSKRRASI